MPIPEDRGVGRGAVKQRKHLLRQCWCALRRGVVIAVAFISSFDSSTRYKENAKVSNPLSSAIRLFEMQRHTRAFGVQISF